VRLTPRYLTLLVIATSTLSCQARPRHDEVAALTLDAERLQRRYTGWSCEPFPENLVGSGTPPFTSCRAQLGDTTAVLVTDSRHVTVATIRSVAAVPGQAESLFTALSRAVSAKGGQGILWCDSSATRRAEAWQNGPYYTLVSLNSAGDRVVVTMEAGRPYCEGVGRQRGTGP
jgi:hypothetical protein